MITLRSRAALTLAIYYASFVLAAGCSGSVENANPTIVQKVRSSTDGGTPSIASCPEGQILVEGECGCPETFEWSNIRDKCECPVGQSVVDAICSCPKNADWSISDRKCFCREGHRSVYSKWGSRRLESCILITQFSMIDEINTNGLTKSVAFSPNGELFVSGAPNNDAQIFVRKTLTLSKSLKREFPGRVRSVAFSPDGKSLASNDSYQIYFWDIESGARTKTLIGHNGLVKSIVFSPNGKYLISGSEDGTARIWTLDGDSDAKIIREAEIIKQPDSINSVAISHDGENLALGNQNGMVLLWKRKTIAGTRVFSTEKSLPLEAVAFSPDGNYLAAGGWKSTIFIWETESKTLVKSLEDPGANIRALAFSPDGKYLASGSDDAKIMIWDMKEMALVETITNKESWIYALAFSPDSEVLASADGDITLWRMKK